MNIKVIQTGIKLYSLLVFSIIPSLKQIAFTSVLTHDNDKRIFHKITSAEFSPLPLFPVLVWRCCQFEELSTGGPLHSKQVRAQARARAHSLTHTHTQTHTHTHVPAPSAIPPFSLLHTHPPTHTHTHTHTRTRPYQHYQLIQTPQLPQRYVTS